MKIDDFLDSQEPNKDQKRAGAVRVDDFLGTDPAPRSKLLDAITSLLPMQPGSVLSGTTMTPEQLAAIPVDPTRSIPQASITQAPQQEMREWIPPEPRGPIRAIADAALGVYQGGAGMVKGVADNVNAGDNPVSKFFGKAIEGADKLKSDDLRNQQAYRNMMIYAARKNQGETGAARAAFNTLFDQPAAGIDVVARGAGSLAPTIGLGALGAGTKVLGTVNALSNAGDAASQTADTLRALPPEIWAKDPKYQQLIGDGMTHAQAVQILAPLLAVPAQGVGAVTGAISGVTGLEKMIAGKAVGNTVRNRAGRVGTELLTEQGETIAPLVAGNATVGSIDGTTPLMAGAGQAAVDTLAGTVPGAALAARRVPNQPAAPAPGAAPAAAPFTREDPLPLDPIDPAAAAAAPAAPVDPMAPFAAQEDAPANGIAALAELIADTAIPESRLETPPTPAAPSIDSFLDGETVTPIPDTEAAQSDEKPAGRDKSSDKVLSTESFEKQSGNGTTTYTFRPDGLLEKRTVFEDGEEFFGILSTNAKGDEDFYNLEKTNAFPVKLDEEQAQKWVDSDRGLDSPQIDPQATITPIAEPTPAPVAESAPAPAIEPSAVQQAEAKIPSQINAPARIDLDKAMQITEAQPGMRPGDLVSVKGTVFTNKSRAQAVVKEAGPGWRVAKSNGGFVGRFQPASEAQIQNARKQAAKQRTIDTEIDSMFAAIAKMGGISQDQAIGQWGMDKQSFKNLYGAGIMRVVTTKGRGLDAMAELLAEAGYLSYDENGKHDVAEFEELFFNELAGSPHYTPEGYARAAQAEDAARYEDYLSEKEAAASGLNDLNEQDQEAVSEFIDTYQDLTEDDYAKLEQEAIEWERAAEGADAGIETDDTGGRLAQDDGSIEADARGEGEGNTNADQTGQAPRQKQAGVREEGAGKQRAEEAQDFTLEGETERETREREERDAARRKADEQKQQEAENKAQADAEVDTFALTGSDRAADTMAAQGQTGLFDQANQAEETTAEDPAPALARPTASKSSSKKLEDAGEELQFNKRNRMASGVKWSDVKDLNDSLKSAEVVKNKVWPKPDYEKMVADGQQPLIAHIYKQVYDSIAAKPATRNNPTDAEFQLYIDAVQRVREGLDTWVNNSASIVKFVGQLGARAAAMSGKKFEVDQIDAKSLYDIVYPEGWRALQAEIRIAGGNKLLGALQPGYTEARRAMKQIDAGWPGKREAWQMRGFKVIENEGKWIYANKYGRKISEHDTQAEAIAAAREATKREAKEGIDETRSSVNAFERIGPDRRMPGENISPEKLMQDFGFRGVNFGNYVKNADRQAHVNAAFDAFHDLAELLNVPAKALSLNGMLGIAFGAQGSGRAAAHFVPGLNEINLTRDSGAGALAHEWGHALDHYFATQAGLATAEEKFLTAHATMPDTRMVNSGGMFVEQPRFGTKIRPEVVDAFRTVVKTMQKRKQTPAEMQASIDASVARAEKNVDILLERFRREFKDKVEAFEPLAKRIKEGDMGEGYVSVGRTRVPEIVNQVRDTYKKEFGRVPNIEDLKGLGLAIEHKDFAAKRAGSDEAHIPQEVSTDFMKRSNAQDGQKGGKRYWSTEWEMFARAFETYVEDKLAEQDRRSGYLSTPLAAIVNPQDLEKAQINNAIQGLVDTLQVQEKGDNAVLFDIRGLTGDSLFNRAPETVRVNALARLKRLETQLEAGKITEELYRSGVQELIEQLKSRNQSQAIKSAVKGRERGYEWMQERLIRAKRKGELDVYPVDFALWALKKNPNLANDLGISVRESDGDASGTYNPASRVISLFKGSASDTTVVHEILHHTERMMPAEIQNGIITEWQNAWDKAWAMGNGKIRLALQDMHAANMGDKLAHDRVRRAFADGTLDYDAHYQLFNASEYWAVNATEIMSRRYDASSWIAKAKRWISEMLEYLKGALNLPSDAPILRALREVMATTGERQSSEMIKENNFGAEDIKKKPTAENPERDETSDLEIEAPGYKFEPISAADFVALEKGPDGRRQYVAGRKLFDRMAIAARDYLGAIKMADNKPEAFKQMMRQFRVDQFKAKENAKRIAETGKDLTPEQRAMVSDLIEKDSKVGDVPPQEIVDLVAGMTTALESQARALVEMGMLSENRLVKNYLPRLYKHHLAAKLTNPQMMQAWFTKARMKIRGDRLKSRGMFVEMKAESVAQAKKLGWKVSSLTDGNPIQGELLEAFDKSQQIPPNYQGTKVLMWRDYTEAERAEMGEIRDGVLRYAMGYVETQKDMATGRLFKAIASNPDLAKAFNPGGWVLIPKTEVAGTDGLKAYGALSGMYVSPQVADSLKRNTQPKGVLMAAYDKGLSWFKEGKTVWNPVSHGNNVVSNLFVAYFAGVNPASPARWKETISEFRNRGTYWNEAVDNGLFGNEIANAEIRDLLMPDFADMADIESVAASRMAKVIEFSKKYPGRPLSWYRENMQKAYEFEDQFFKLMLYIDRRKSGMDPQASITDTERYVFNYSDMPEGVELIKRTYAPFFSYTYRAVPMMLHTAMTRPDRLLVPITLLAGANWLAYAILGAEEEKERKALPDYMQGRTAMGTQKAIRMPFNLDDKPAFLDMSRRVPMGDLFDVNNQAGGLPVPAPMMPSHPVLSLMGAMAFNVDGFTGKEIVKKSDDAWEAASARSGYVYRQLAPNAPFVPGSYNFNKIMDASANVFGVEMGPYTGLTRSGDPVNPIATALDVTGIGKIRTFDPEKSLDYKGAALGREEKEIRANIRSAGRNRSMTEDTREDYLERQRDKLEKLKRKKEELRE